LATEVATGSSCCRVVGQALQVDVALAHADDPGPAIAADQAPVRIDALGQV
jgi:hypothetical protein